MNFIEKGGSFDDPGKTTNGACSAMVVLVSRTHSASGLEDIVVNLGS
jgi:hypothetical protein